MKLSVGRDGAEFASDRGAVAGLYHFDNPWKPYLAPLNSPAGHNLMLAMSHDHKHQRGLMYALRAKDVNWWEERVVREGEAIGVVRHERLDAVRTTGQTLSLSHTLLWTDQAGALDTFRETRTLTCSETAEGFAWRWQAKFEVLRDAELVLSQWAHPRPDGSKVNYHGLGFRFIRDFDGAFKQTKLIVDGAETTADEAIGSRPKVVTLTGLLDGFEVAPRAGVTIRQSADHPLFIMTEPYPLLSLGPSNLGPVSFRKGDSFAEDFQFLVFDGEPPAGAA